MKTGSLFLVLVLLTTLFFAVESRASLGDPEASIEADGSSIPGRRGPPQARTGYTVHELVADAVTVREYVNASGTVFAITWTGISTPDLTGLLGSFASECEDASKGARIPGHRGLAVNTGRVILERWGHMRNLQGRAYVPALLPNGVNIDEIR